MSYSENNKELPQALVDLIEAFGALPGVGARTAERYAYAVFKGKPVVAERLAESLTKIHSDVAFCPITHALIDSGMAVSPLYADDSRDKSLVVIVEDAFDLLAIERTKQFRGTYHVLGGVISPIDGVGPEHLFIPQLLRRLDQDKVTEVILGLSSSVEGESTSLYVQRAIVDSGLDNIKITRLARGLPVGVDLEFADQMTLTHALQGREKMENS